MIKRIMSLLTLCVALALLCACSNNVEINELAFVMGVAVDKGEAVDEYSITTQFAKPGALKASAGEGGSSSGGGPNAYVNITTTGIGVEMPMDRLRMQIDRSLYTGHNQVVVIGMDVATDNVSPVLDSLARNSEGRFAVTLFVAREDAKGMLDVKGELEKLPAVYLKKLISSEIGYGEISEATMLSFITGMLSKTSSPTIPVIGIADDGEDSGQKQGDEKDDVQQENKRAQLCGMAAFKDASVCMILDPEQTKAMLLVKGRAKDAVFQIDVFDSYTTLKIKDSNVNITPIFNGDDFEKIIVDMHFEGAVTDTGAQTDIFTEDARAQIADAAKKYLQSSIEDTFEYTQEHNADVFGFGEKLYRFHPHKAKSLVDNWEEEYPNITVEFKVDFEVSSTGAIIHPLIPNSGAEYK